jgi:Tol biopolymer transport system component
MTTGGTRTGMILGTAAYMSPEQARGRPLDKRTDIFSFGCVMYECLTGGQAYRGETVSDTLAAILKSEPDWRELPSETPGQVRDLLRRCLEKTRERRLHDIADARLEIEEALVAPAPSAPAAVSAPASPAVSTRAIVWAAAAFGLVAGALAALLILRTLRPAPPPPRMPPVRSVLPLPAGMNFIAPSFRSSVAISPDGGKLVLRATRGGVTQLYLQTFERLEASPIAGTERGHSPFFSPDGEWLGFFTATEILKVSLSGGSPLTIATTSPVAGGAAWAPDGSIIFANTSNGGLSRVSSGGGPVEKLTTVGKGEHALLFPQILPDGKNVLLVVRAGRDFLDVARSNIAVHSLVTGRRRVLVEGANYARYVAPGYLLYTKGTTLLAARCDSRTWTLTGPAAPLVQDILTTRFDGVPFFAASGNGLLVYSTGGVATSPPDSVLWVDRSGKEKVLPLPTRTYSAPRLSPDGKLLAIVAGQTDGPRNALSIYDFDRNILSTITPEPGAHFSPAWSPDGRRLVFSTYGTGFPRLSWKAADGNGEIEMLSPGAAPEFPTSWSSDGRTILYATVSPESIANADLWVLSLEGKRERRAWMAGPPRELAAFFSPDGRSVAYVSDESGKNEVYVRPYPGAGPKIKISSEGGAEPAWAPDGREIFYRAKETFMAVPIRTDPELSAGQPHPLFPDRFDRWAREDGSRNYDVARDGSRFLFIRGTGSKQEPITRLDLVTNWPAQIERARGEKP